MTIADANDKIAEKVVGGYKAVENAVTGGYKKVENVVTGGFEKVEDKFVDKFLRKEGETVEEAEERLKKEQVERKEKQEAEATRARSVSAKLAGEFCRTDAGRRGSEATEERAEKIAKMSSTKTTAEIQAEIKEKYNL